ncbi:hypothetical protein COL83_21275 [Bacillus wiedmannii]|nr:hypothetical protein COL83_21275 [Bacillus wiedmannii]
MHQWSRQAVIRRIICRPVLVQKLQDNCNKSTNLGHTDTTNLKKVLDWYGKGKCIQIEALSA